MCVCVGGGGVIIWRQRNTHKDVDLPITAMAANPNRTVGPWDVPGHGVYRNCSPAWRACRAVDSRGL